MRVGDLSLVEMAEKIRALVSPVIISTVANLPAAGSQWRRVAVVTNGRKTGEGAGAGTGVLAYDDGSNWVNSYDANPVAA